MNRITLLALGFISLGIATSASAQTKVTQLVIQNTTGTTKLSQTSTGLDIDNKVVLHNPNVLGNTVTLMVPSNAGMGNANFTFPTSGGTLLTTTADNTNGDAIIAAINAGTTTINAARLNLTGLGMISSVAAGNTSLNISTLAGAVTASLNTANANTWTATQTFPLTINQGNAIIDAINVVGTNALTGYVTNSYLTSNYSTTAQMNSAIAASAGSGGSPTLTKGTFSLSNGPNNDLSLGSATYARISGPTNAFGIRGISAGTNGKMIIVQNLTTSNMSVVNMDNSAANGTKIITSGISATTTGEGSFTLIYDTSADSGNGAWLLVSSSL